MIATETVIRSPVSRNRSRKVAAGKRLGGHWRQSRPRRQRGPLKIDPTLHGGHNGGDDGSGVGPDGGNRRWHSIGGCGPHCDLGHISQRTRWQRPWALIRAGSGYGGETACAGVLSGAGLPAPYYRSESCHNPRSVEAEIGEDGRVWEGKMVVSGFELPSYT